MLSLCGQVINKVTPCDDGGWLVVCRRNRRFKPRDRKQGMKQPVRQLLRRRVTDLPVMGQPFKLDVELALVTGPDGRRQMEHSELVDPYCRYTRRMCRLISAMCRHMSISAVARHLKLDWRTVKTIDQRYLEQTLPALVPEDLRDIPRLGVDEVARAKGHDYMTVVYDMERGHLIWVGVGRTANVLSQFLQRLHPEAVASVQAVAMDMGPAYQKAVRENLPEADIVFDRFHVMKMMSKAIDNQRRVEFRRADKAGKQLIKGTRFLLLHNSAKLNSDQQSRLQHLLANNYHLNQMYILKEQLQTLWDCPTREAMNDDLNAWCECVDETHLAHLKIFAGKLRKFRIGICNYAKHRITSAPIEAGNIAIGMIRKRARGLLDNEYFKLKIRQSSLPDDESMIYVG